MSGPTPDVVRTAQQELQSQGLTLHDTTKKIFMGKVEEIHGRIKQIPGSTPKAASKSSETGFSKSKKPSLIPRPASQTDSDWSEVSNPNWSGLPSDWMGGDPDLDLCKTSQKDLNKATSCETAHREELIRDVHCEHYQQQRLQAGGFAKLKEKVLQYMGTAGAMVMRATLVILLIRSLFATFGAPVDVAENLCSPTSGLSTRMEEQTRTDISTGPP